MNKSFETKEEFARHVWDTLSCINVNDHVETKGTRGGTELRYLSWAWAYQIMMQNFPTFSFSSGIYLNERHEEITREEDGTATVWCTGSIECGEFVLSKTMYLPVLDGSNRAIENPTSMQINTARQRCLAKLISLFGLAAYIYSGEDLPHEEPTKKSTAKKQKVSKATASKPKPEKSDYEWDLDFAINNEEDAEFVSERIISLAENMHSNNLKNLLSFWKKNQGVITHLQEEHPECFTKVKDKFSEIKSQLEMEQ